MFLKHYFSCACYCAAFIIFMIVWSLRNGSPQLSKDYSWFMYQLTNSGQTTQQPTRDATTYAAQSTRTSKPECRIINFYELYNKSSQTSNMTLYVTHHNIWLGRLGNQMFKYASMLGIARAQGRHMFILPGTDLEKTFKLSYVAVNDTSKLWPIIGDINGNKFHAKLINLPVKDMRIDGYLQSFWYFAAVMDEVRQEFTFQDSVANEAAKLFHDVYVKHNSSMIVGVHLRRGDFLQKRHQDNGYGVPEKSYFMKAFSLMKSKFSGRNITFLVVSDDLPWCSNNLLSDDVVIIPDAPPSVHMAVLSSCDHVIISGGTYGWWSGWMANGYVIYYTGYMREGTFLGNQATRYQYYPRLWIGLGN